MRLVFSIYPKPNQFEAKFSEMRAGLWEYISIADPSPEENLFRLDRSLNFAEIAKVFPEDVFLRLLKGLQSLGRLWWQTGDREINLISPKRRIIGLTTQFLNKSVVNGLNGWSSSTVFNEWTKRPPMQWAGIRRVYEPCSLKMSEIDKGALNRLQRLAINPVGITHRRPLAIGYNRISHSCCSNDPCEDHQKPISWRHVSPLFSQLLIPTFIVFGLLGITLGVFWFLFAVLFADRHLGIHMMCSLMVVLGSACLFAHGLQLIAARY